MSEVENVDQDDVNEDLEINEIEAAGNEENPDALDIEQGVESGIGEEGQVEEDGSSPEKGAEEQTTISVAELEKLQNQLKQKEDFIQKRNSEVGDLKKRELELQTQLSSRPSDDELRDELDNVDAYRQMRDTERLEDEQLQLQSKIHQLEAEETVTQAIPNFEELKDDIVKLAKSDGLPEKDIVDLQTNPFVFKPQDVIGLARRAQNEREIASMKKKIDDLSSSKQNLAKNIAKAANGGKTITAASGQSTPINQDLTRQDITKLNRKELEELYEQLE
jgi:hypothetical protein